MRMRDRRPSPGRGRPDPLLRPRAPSAPPVFFDRCGSVPVSGVAAPRWHHGPAAGPPHRARGAPGWAPHGSEVSSPLTRGEHERSRRFWNLRAPEHEWFMLQPMAHAQSWPAAQRAGRAVGGCRGHAGSGARRPEPHMGRRRLGGGAEAVSAERRPPPPRQTCPASPQSRGVAPALPQVSGNAAGAPGPSCCAQPGEGTVPLPLWPRLPRGHAPGAAGPERREWGAAAMRALRSGGGGGARRLLRVVAARRARRAGGGGGGRR